MRAARLVVLALLVSSCALPLSRDVKTTGVVPADQRQGEGLVQVLPEGPKEGAAPEEVVNGFLGAQSNAGDRHAIARKFLSEELRGVWSDDAEVLVYNPATLTVAQVLDPASPSDRATVRVSVQVTGAVRRDGSYSPRAPAKVVEDYRLRQVPKDGWQLTDVPPGLRLTAADRQRSFRVADLHYLARRLGDDPPQLVPDKVLLPISSNPAETVIHRLLQPPSQAVAGSVMTAIPAGTQAKSVRTSGDGTVEVDLTKQVLALSGTARQAMSAQFVWTLRSLVGGGFTGLRLTVEGAPFAVPDQGAVQDPGAWNAFDPDGLAPDPPYFFVQDRRLRAIGETLPPGPATAGEAGLGQAVAVDSVAVTPDRTRVALLERRRDGTVAVRAGPLRAASYPVVLRQTGLSSPSWGSGDQGLWLLRGGAEVLLLTANGNQIRVRVSAGPTGTMTSLAVSRDGARVALVSGGALWVGRVDLTGAVPRLADLAQVAPGLLGVTRVAWAGSTTLVVLARIDGAVLPVRVAVDGLTVEPLNGPNLPRAPVELAASPDGVVVTSQGRLFELTPRGFVAGQLGRAPAFPG